MKSSIVIQHTPPTEDVSFRDLNDGDWFIHSGVTHSRHGTLCIRLTPEKALIVITGVTVPFGPHTPVTAVNVEIKVKHRQTPALEKA